MNPDETPLDPSLNLLRGAMIEAEASDPEEDSRLVRRLHLQRTQKQLRYWLPTAIGAGAFAVGFLALLQILGAPMSHPRLAQPSARLLKSDRLPGLSEYKDVSAVQK